MGINFPGKLQFIPKSCGFSLEDDRRVTISIIKAYITIIENEETYFDKKKITLYETLRRNATKRAQRININSLIVQKRRSEIG